MAKICHHICHFSSFFLILFFLNIIFSMVDGKISAVIVFGDSSVDTGNNNGINTLLKSNFEPYGRDFEGGRPTGRFSNGRVPVDFFSEYFGLKKYVPAYLDPNYGMKDFISGVNFASAGTGYDNTTSSVLVSFFFYFLFLRLIISHNYQLNITHKIKGKENYT